MRGDSVSTERRQQGFTLTEMGIVVGLVGVLTAIAVSALTALFENQRLTNSAITVSNAVSQARGDAIRTGNVHLVFFRVDETGTPLVDGSGNPVDVLIVDDGRLGTAGQNCSFDAGEDVVGFDLEDRVSFAVSDATSTVATDSGSSTISNGSSLEDGATGAASWLMFRAEGPAYGFKSDCNIGAVGSGGGGIYLTNGDRDVALVITPLGTTRLHRWGDGGWTD
ncbi:MAG: pilus assembly FimT family protein [Miltoncostaeaceae bacterium]